MKIYNHFLLLALYTMSCEQPYIESSNSSSFPGKFKTNRDWWPNQLDLSVLRKHSSHSDPMGENFSYRESFNSLDYASIKSDLNDLMTESQDWWPADYGHYGPFFIRMACIGLITYVHYIQKVLLN